MYLVVLLLLSRCLLLFVIQKYIIPLWCLLLLFRCTSVRVAEERMHVYTRMAVLFQYPVSNYYLSLGPWQRSVSKMNRTSLNVQCLFTLQRIASHFCCCFVVVDSIVLWLYPLCKLLLLCYCVETLVPSI